MLAHELTDGTKLPFDFARETLKLCALAALGQNPNRPRLPWFDKLHTRQYLILVGDPSIGKGETMYRIKRTIEKSLAEGLPWPVRFLRGDSLGSPQYAVTEFGGTIERVGKPTVVPSIPVEIDRSEYGRIVVYDEGRALAEKDSTGGAGRGLVTMFTALYEENGIATGSFKNGKASVEQADVSLILHFTPQGFDATFTGTGVTTGGFLSRCTIIRKEPTTFTRLWRTVESTKVRELVAKIMEDCKRTELPQDEGVEIVRQRVALELDKADKHRAARLLPLFVQDCYARAMFSEEGRLTVEIANAAEDWTIAQLRARAETWPLDGSSDRNERLHMAISQAFKNASKKWDNHLSLRDLKQAVNLHRQGSGGPGAFMYCLKNMIAAREIEPAGENARGYPLFRWIGDAE